MDSSDTIIHGDTDEGFGAVADAFAANFERHGELGAAFSLYVDGAQHLSYDKMGLPRVMKSFLNPAADS